MCRERDVGYIGGFPISRERDVGYIEGFPTCREHDVGHIEGIPMCRGRDVGYIGGISICRERDVGYIEGFSISRERDVGHMDAQMRDKARSSPAVGLLRALRTHFASAPFSAPVADFRGRQSCRSLPGSYGRSASGSGRCRWCGVCGGSGA